MIGFYYYLHVFISFNIEFFADCLSLKSGSRFPLFSNSFPLKWRAVSIAILPFLLKNLTSKSGINQHKGHPGHDIFILDLNQDGLDDKTGKPVEVIAAASGVVVSINFHWEPSSPIRGGNYIWIYEPIKSRYYYYAHLNEIFIKVGQVVSKGERLGTMGRTGVKAYPKKSPTHLHFTVHQSKEGYPKPINPFMELIKASHQER